MKQALVTIPQENQALVRIPQENQHVVGISQGNQAEIQIPTENQTRFVKISSFGKDSFRKPSYDSSRKSIDSWSKSKYSLWESTNTLRSPLIFNDYCMSHKSCCARQKKPSTKLPRSHLKHMPKNITNKHRRELHFASAAYVIQQLLTKGCIQFSATTIGTCLSKD